MKAWLSVCLWGLILVQSGFRFANLELSPPGFYADEATGAINAICLREEGRSEMGVRYPLFFRAYRAYHPPTQIYAAALWSGVFGTSIASFRALAAFLTTLTLVGIYLLARLFLGSQGALMSLFAASLSPWGFQFSRVAWEGPMLPLLSVWGTYFLLRRNNTLGYGTAGVLFALALYAYGPGQLFVPLLVGLLLAFKWKQKELHLKGLLVLFTVMAIISFPLLYYLVFTDLGGRYRAIGVLTQSHLSQYGQPSPGLALSIFSRNLLTHLQPGFLFVHGDRNLRHSPQFVGEMSWVDMLALGLLVPLLVRRFSRKSVGEVPLLYLGLSMLGFFAALVPSALTWEHVPHALRSIAGWPFLALFTGAVLTVTCSRRPAAAAIVASVGLLFMAHFHYNYLSRYPAEAKSWFDHTVKETAVQARQLRRLDLITALLPRYSRPALKYYLAHYGMMSCGGAEEFMRQSGELR